MEWHPDKHEGEDKAKAEKMFMDIAAAKEVLTDPGKSALKMGISLSEAPALKQGCYFLIGCISCKHG